MLKFMETLFVKLLSRTPEEFITNHFPSVEPEVKISLCLILSLHLNVFHLFLPMHMILFLRLFLSHLILSMQRIQAHLIYPCTWFQVAVEESCIYTCTPDWNPVIDTVPDSHNVVFAVGFSGAASHVVATLYSSKEMKSFNQALGSSWDLLLGECWLTLPRSYNPQKIATLVAWSSTLPHLKVRRGT